MKNLLLAILCVFLFGLTAPFTRVAVLEISAEALILLRILGASIVCLIYLCFTRWSPPKEALPGIAMSALGTVIGFNSLIAFGLREVPSGHAAVALASLPMVSAIYAVIRDRSKPGGRFWIFALAGTCLSVGFFFVLNFTTFLRGDVLLVLAVFSASFGYVEGGRVSRVYGGAKVMSWAVMMTLPIVIPLTIMYFNSHQGMLQDLSIKGWLSVAYVGFLSQSLGMFLWFSVLARGPMEKIALVQLLQPFFTLAGAMVILNEEVSTVTWIVAVLVAACVFFANRERKKSVEVIRT